jgi:uncharacterized protein YjbI with pentapeptide repeats
MRGANLFGVDLSQATLTQVDFQDANLGGIKINKTVFSSISGLSREMEKEIRQQSYQNK